MKSLYMTTEQIRDRVKVKFGNHYSVEYIGRETRRARAKGLADFRWFENHEERNGEMIKTRYKKWRLPQGAA